MRRPRPSALGVAALLLLGLGGALLGETAGWAGDDRVGLRLGNQPPTLTATDLQGRTHRLVDYRGRVVVLHFWSSWCPYCRGEIPELIQLHREGGTTGVVVLAVSSDEDIAKVRQFVAQQHLPYAVIADVEADFTLSRRYQIRGIPVTYVMDRAGRIAGKINGSGDITGIVGEALARPGAA